jgi:hypothetical protein
MTDPEIDLEDEDEDLTEEATGEFIDGMPDEDES